MKISPVSFKRVAVLQRPINYNDKLKEAYLNAGKYTENVEVTPDTIIERPTLWQKKTSEFDSSGNMICYTICEDSKPITKYIYYPGINKASAAIDYNYGKVKEVSLFDRRGDETDNFNYKTMKAEVNGVQYELSGCGNWVPNEKS